jgi:hypothetical protein
MAMLLALVDFAAIDDLANIEAVFENMCERADHEALGNMTRPRAIPESAVIDLAPRGINCVLLNPGWVRTYMDIR